MKYINYDVFSKNPIRLTDNSLKDCDMPGFEQNYVKKTDALVLDRKGVPVGWKPPEKDVSDG